MKFFFYETSLLSSLACICLFTSLCLGYGSNALAESVPKEMAGGKDHPLVSRYAGSVLQDFGRSNFAELSIPTNAGKSAKSETPFDGSEKAAGSLNAYFYVNPKNVSALEVFRNYQQALANGGFTALYACELKVCEKDAINSSYRDLSVESLKWKSNSRYAGSAMERDVRFVSAKKVDGSSITHVVLYVGEPNSIWGAPTTAILILEAAAMQTGQVVVNTAAMKKGLESSGMIALYGIYFDTAKSDVKPESKPQLQEMAKLLAETPSLNVYIVGHTDNEGSIDSNTTLSQRRAEAVSAALVTQYKIDRKRLSAKGVASLAPLAANNTVEGRGKNRRVELVVQ